MTKLLIGSKIWNRVKELVSKSWEALIKFMAIESDVSFNNRISW